MVNDPKLLAGLKFTHPSPVTCSSHLPRAGEGAFGGYPQGHPPLHEDAQLRGPPQAAESSPSKEGEVDAAAQGGQGKERGAPPRREVTPILPR